MKTSELIARLTELGYITTLDGNTDELWVIVKHHGVTFYHIEVYGMELRILGEIRSHASDFKALKFIMIYLETPLEEREEEKKYYLRFPKGYNSWYNYLAKEINKDNGEYDCSGKCIDNEKYKNIFTQKEIDAIPFDINFFIKEEVKC